MKHSLLALAFAGVVIALLCVIVQSTASLESPRHPQVSTEGERLTIATLGPNERVVILYRSAGCFHRIERLYQVEGAPLRFGAKAANLSGTEESPADIAPLFGRLSDQEAMGLDAYLFFLRHNVPGGCTTTDHIVVGHYRNGMKIGEERFRDRTCLTSGFRWEKERVVAPEERDGLSGFPVEAFRTIVPPWLVEQRLRNPRSTGSGLTAL